MRLARAVTALICRALIGVFLCAQMALAAHACPIATPEPASHGPEMASGMPGCDGMVQPDTDLTNVCVEHCKVGQQTFDSGTAPGVIAPLPALLCVVSAPALVHTVEDRIASSVDPLLAATPPPHAILHCVLRI